jgi:hypothetical protein
MTSRLAAAKTYGEPDDDNGKSFLKHFIGQRL